MLILVSIGFGVFQVLYGFFLKARLSRQSWRPAPFLGGSRLLGGVRGPGPVQLRFHDRGLSPCGSSS